MNEINLIKDVFNEKRNIVGRAPEEMIETDNELKGREIFITDENELIDLEYQLNDFDEEELVNYVELAEKLYEKSNSHVSVYVLCSKNIRVLAPECTIKSEADFTIKLACHDEGPAYAALRHIRDKINKNIRLTDDDFDMLSVIPMMVSDEDRRELRIECFKLINNARRY